MQEIICKGEKWRYIYSAFIEQVRGSQTPRSCKVRVPFPLLSFHKFLNFRMQLQHHFHVAPQLIAFLFVCVRISSLFPVPHFQRTFAS